MLQGSAGDPSAWHSDDPSAVCWLPRALCTCGIAKDSMNSRGGGGSLGGGVIRIPLQFGAPPTPRRPSEQPPSPPADVALSCRSKFTDSGACWGWPTKCRVSLRPTHEAHHLRGCPTRRPRTDTDEAPVTVRTVRHPQHKSPVAAESLRTAPDVRIRGSVRPSVGLSLCACGRPENNYFTRS